MAKWEISSPDGRKYEVEADTEDLAYKAYENQVKQEVADEYGHLPWYGKAKQAVLDQARIASNFVTGGYRDEFAGTLGLGGTPEQEKFETHKARRRAGSAGTGMELATALALGKLMPPTANPMTAGMTEGGIVGGLQASAHDENVPLGVLGGASLGGALGTGSAFGHKLKRSALKTATTASEGLGTLRFKDALYGGGGAFGLNAAGINLPPAATAAILAAIPAVGMLGRAGAKAGKAALKKVKPIKPSGVEHWTPETRQFLESLGITAQEEK